MIDISKVTELESVKAIKNVLNGITLEDFQTVDILTALVRKRAIIAHDTGMGKTLIASAIMKMLHNENNSRKFIMIVKRSQFDQTPDKIAKATGLKVVAISSEFSKISENILDSSFLKNDVVILSAECLNSLAVMSRIYAHRKLFYGLIVDEAHEFSNIYEADRSFRLQCMSYAFEYFIALTATPITTELEQFSRLLYLVDKYNFYDIKDTTRSLERGEINLEKMYPGLYIRRTRSDLGIANTYNPTSILVEPTPDQVGKCGLNMFKYTKGPGAEPQVNKLIEVINRERPNKGIVYIRHHAVRRYVEEQLKGTDIRYATINGLTPMSARKTIMDNFAKNEYDVILISVTTSVDLDCDYIFFYEFTADVKQVIGRGERGLIPKTLNLYFLFTLQTAEIDYFNEKIFKRSVMIQEILGRDYAELIDIGKQLGLEYKEEDDSNTKANYL